MNLALEIQYRTSGESESLQIRVKGHVLEVIVVVGAPKGANEAFVDNAPIRVDQLHLLLAPIVCYTILDQYVVAS